MSRIKNGPYSPCRDRFLSEGDDRIRTGDEGFADPCLTTWPRRQSQTGRSTACRSIFQSGRRDSNSRPSPWQGDVLPLNYTRIDCRLSARTQTRTGDTCIFSAVLYQLSYPGRWSSDCRKAMLILSKRYRAVKFVPGCLRPLIWL